MNTLTDIRDALTKNRAEELGHDVWNDFVIPLFFDELDLKKATKPRVVVGGRGCGKTMLLRYLSHDTCFSPKKDAISQVDIDYIGLYWRADTQFVNAMDERLVDKSVWEYAFSHMIAINISIELLRSIENLANSKGSPLSGKEVGSLSFPKLKAFDKSFAGSFKHLRDVLESKQMELETWVGNPRKVPEPIFLPGRKFILHLINTLKEQLGILENSCFTVYVDEYENLRSYQQQIINTYLKHSESPLIFSLAMKRNGMRTKQTLSEECITDVADYRLVDLDGYLSEQHSFNVYAAEIFLMRLSVVAGGTLSLEVGKLNSEEELQKRRDPEYQKRVLTIARGILPGLDRQKLAEIVFQDSKMLKRLEELITQALKDRKSKYKAGLFLREKYREASIIVPALLCRSNLSPEAILTELNALEAGDSNRFTGRTDWIHNNFEGCLLFLYSAYDRTCPFYAGFDTYITLAQGNLRHFFELCHKALRRSKTASSGREFVIPPIDQAEAAKQASTTFINEIRGFGRYGNRLHSFVITLGKLFALAQRRSSQSEPEINHFSVLGGDGQFKEQEQDFFREAVKWSVLVDCPETKIKDPLQSGGSDWVLNPIYSPYFHITYRKRRKIIIRSEDVVVLIRGNYQERLSLLRVFSKKWALDLGEPQLTLFANLDSGLL